MIPEEVENRIAIYFFHRYLPEEVMEKVVDRFTTLVVLETEDEDLDMDEMVLWAIHIIDKELDR